MRKRGRARRDHRRRRHLPSEHAEPKPETTDRTEPESESSTGTAGRTAGGWMAPEALDRTGARFDWRLADCFSLGCVMCFVLSGGAHPFGDTTMRRVGNILAGRADVSAVEPTARELVARLLSNGPAARPTAAECLQHPLFW